MWLNTLLLALRSIRRNLMRSFLTILGIVIGVSAVITMVTVGNGATLAIQNQISGLGTNLLQVRPGQRMMGGGGGAPPFKEIDAQAVATQVSGITAVAPEARSGATIILDGRNWSSSVIGSTNNWLFTGNWKVADGREFTMEEQVAGAAVCLIGETVRRELFGSQAAVGATIRVKQIACEVIGVLSAKGQGAFGNDQDDLVFMPLHTLQRRITGNTRVNTLLVSMQDGADPERVKAGITELLRERRKLAESDENNFNVLDTKQLGEAFSSTTKVMTTLLGAVAAVSLLVGGIGIMNIMLVSVTERTREIGLRLAIGALEREVLLQFLIEAVVLSALGGVIGIVLATGASIGLSKLMDVPFVFDLGINALAFVFSAGIGVLFGYFPARRAARLDPIEALRHE
ncbi:MAG: multidrug ABC transporter substrate-binding protein [Comamonadaceae bacterium CG_4_9_14_0_8_um_filter_60_18]|nr:MAG: multidrug ABC transporter substrate-binding protein [Comamonadaceae bacterium CG2_30_60_41]PIW08905.1 MAG: multidrug ABC transporter substrate-binding protein [Comamonadaceae bacterium CG17_big_fil_post_rev_8_21_14_2_50_60_13]PIY25777.1 MAG: multidrug ABC transporter substrate-binding protein [Comamonadaceae bacterium CG_4_10_14_3_um_filter_60_75]PJC14613.1 MAG: multidrug ABC transporter substrate-binding protein [Comamonadaceae bacterium CG_4_9_14_0_8_um_filter_60_18]